MPFLILAGVVALVIYLYVLWIGWLSAEVAPTIFFGLAVAGSMSIAVVYARSLRRTFTRGPGSPWNRWFPLVYVLVGLIYVDFFLLGLLESGSLRFEGSVSIFNPLRLWFLRIGLVGTDLDIRSAGGLLLLRLFAKSALLVPVLLLARGLSSSMRDAAQPALLSYYHGQAWADVRTVVSEIAAFYRAIWAWCVAKLRWWRDHRYDPDEHWKPILVVGVLFAPLVLAIVNAVVFVVFFALLQALGFVVVHSAVLAGGLLVERGIAIGFYLSERAVIALRYGDARCPHAGCYETVRLPVFRCPDCGVGHDRLVPGRCGVLTRTCRCGTGRLPTLLALGKGKLASACPACGGSLSEELFRSGVHIPIYGGPSAGKTMYMMAATWELMEARVPDVLASLVGESAADAYSNQWKPEFESGLVRNKTASSLPDAVLLAVRRGEGVPASVYFYDPAGEALRDEASLQAHRFIKHVDGFMLLVDPLSLDSIAKTYYDDNGGPDVRRTTSPDDPEETLARVVNELEHFGVLSANKRSSVRLAVVVTKTDLPGVAETFGGAGVGSKAVQDWKGLGAARSARIREWFAAHESRLLQILETRFADVRFFAVSALGRIPEDSGGGATFSPQRVMEPLAWLLSIRSKFTRPRFDRVVGRGTVLLTPVVVFGIFFALLTPPVVWAQPWLADAVRVFLGRPVERHEVVAADSGGSRAGLRRATPARTPGFGATAAPGPASTAVR